MTFALPSRYVNAIFCDDVREEEGGKMSYMGIYRGDMLIAAPLPLMLPKFVVIAHYSEPASEQWVPLTIRVYLPGQEDDAAPAFQVVLPPEAAGTPPADEPLDYMSRQIIMPITFAPFPVAKSGKVRLHVERGGTVYRAGALTVRGGDEVSSATESGSDAAS